MAFAEVDKSEKKEQGESGHWKYVLFDLAVMVDERKYHLSRAELDDETIVSC